MFYYYKMNNIPLVLFLSLIVILIATYYTFGNEPFDAQFNKDYASTEYLQAVDLGDHKTMAHLQKGDNNQTVLLLHNSPMNQDIWRPLFRNMQRISMTGISTPTLVSYDLRGHGTAWMPVDPKYNDSDINNYAWTLKQYVDDCRQIYERVIGTGKVIICGFGFGGLIAQKYALTYPDTIIKLVLLQTSIRPMPGLNTEITYLSGPTGWIAKNPNVTYLTSEERFVHKTLCEWFYLPPDSNCPKDPLVEATHTNNNDRPTPQYNLTESLWRRGSSTSTLQADKLLVSTDLVQDWIQAKDVPFMIHILAATDDPLAPPDMMTNTYTAIYNNNRHVLVVFDIVDGRHGFTIMRPDYIATIVCDSCRTMNTINNLTSTIVEY